jgi:hypothetical protein
VCFENKVNSFSVFCHMSRDEICMQLLAKGFLLIKDAKLLELDAYPKFISPLVALWLFMLI